MPVIKKVSALILMSLGMLLLLISILPIVVHQIKFTLSADSVPLIDPSYVTGRPMPYITNVLGVSKSEDLTLADNWFSSDQIIENSQDKEISFFSLSIPSVNMQNISVTVNGSDLKKSAIHYPNTSLPGDWGNVVVFGHSSLPQFFKAGNPLTVFNPILNVKLNEEIFIYHEGVQYKYLVKKTMEVTPDQIEVLLQKYDRRELTLVTCVPLGTYWRRFVVKAELQENIL